MPSLVGCLLVYFSLVDRKWPVVPVSSMVCVVGGEESSVGVVIVFNLLALWRLGFPPA
jgi:hypothetical protein